MRIGVILTVFLLALRTACLAQTNEQRTIIVAVGASGESQYAEQYAAAAQLWKESAARGGFVFFAVGLEKEQKEPNDREQLMGILTNQAAKPGGELWFVLLGHGTHDGRSAKFNLRGPDIAVNELAAALKPCARPLVVINCASASGPFLTGLSASNRIIITATRNGNEVNATRLGGDLAKAIADPAADLDKDGQTTLLEAFLFASRQVDQFYKESGRLATEHSLLDDNGDGQGTPSDWFTGTRAVKTAANGRQADGLRANQTALVRGAMELKLSVEARARRDALEKKLSDLRLQKAKMNEIDYYAQLEAVLVEIARIYQ